MARFKLIREALGYPPGTVIASDYWSVIPGDVMCPSLCQKPEITVMVPLDHRAATVFQALGVNVMEGWEPPKETST
jgi:hypothetical protein